MHVMSLSVTTLSLFHRVTGFVAGANPSCLQAKAEYTLDKSPAHRRAPRSNLGVQYLAQGHLQLSSARGSRDLNQQQTLRPLPLADLLYPLSYSSPWFSNIRDSIWRFSALAATLLLDWDFSAMTTVIYIYVLFFVPKMGGIKQNQFDFILVFFAGLG